MTTALFTGAGASRALGYPLTVEFMPLIRERIRAGTLFDALMASRQASIERRDLKAMLSKLFPGCLAKSVPDDALPLVTDVVSLADYAASVGEWLPAPKNGSPRRLSQLIGNAIIDVLVDGFLDDYDEGDPTEHHQKQTLKALIAWIRSHTPGTLGVVTTNYDIGIEYGLYRGGPKWLASQVDLGFSWRDVESGSIVPRPVDPTYRFYKLHGSLNALRCPVCGYVYVNPDGSIIHQAYRPQSDENNTCECSAIVRLEPWIVPPSFVRTIRDPSFLATWQSALEFLRTADRWVIVGYSLPSEDLAIRSLLVRARAGHRRPEGPQVTVVQLDASRRPTYERFFPGCDFRTGGLEEFLRQGAVFPLSPA